MRIIALCRYQDTLYNVSDTRSKFDVKAFVMIVLSGQILTCVEKNEGNGKCAICYENWKVHFVDVKNNKKYLSFCLILKLYQEVFKH
jgi:hypothetical protein